MATKTTKGNKTTKPTKLKVVEELEETEEVEETVLSKKSSTKTVTIERGLDLEVTLMLTDIRLVFALDKVQDLTDKKRDLTVSETKKLTQSLKTILDLSIGEDGFEKAADFYVEKHGIFDIEDMSKVLEGIFKDDEKK